MQADSEFVTVITATRGRPEPLRRAAHSVTTQCCDHVAVHLVLVDDCTETWQSLAADTPTLVCPRMVHRGPSVVTGPRRLGELRDLGAELSRTRWIAFLDDDNEWLPGHLHSLLSKAQETGAPAVHSWLRVIDTDSQPFLDPMFPWAKDGDAGRAEYERLERLGVVERGSNIYRDRADRGEGPDDVRSVDGGEWLLDRALARTVGFSFEFNEYDRVNLIGDDDKFLEALIAHKSSIACTEKATLVYRLGGFSNSSASRDEISWL